MIKYVSGDILQTEAKAIAHGVAPNDDFKQGLALSLREQWPAMYKDFRHFCKTTHPKEGTLWAWKGAGGPAIFNLFTQEHPRTDGAHPGKATLSYVSHSLKELKKEVEKEGIESIALTKLATGVGGLPWSEVKPVIESTFSEGSTRVFVYETFHKGQKADEA
jgi:O-acetyl-ADP-ribose deacetylase (regulator of RNase III)